MRGLAADLHVRGVTVTADERGPFALRLIGAEDEVVDWLSGNSTTTTTAATPAANSNDSATALPISGYFVQVAAVSKQEDAEALVDALKKKEYPAFVAAQATTDKLFRVQLGPYGEAKEAEAMRTRLIGDGYSPILKK